LSPSFYSFLVTHQELFANHSKVKLEFKWRRESRVQVNPFSVKKKYQKISWPLKGSSFKIQGYLFYTNCVPHPCHQIDQFRYIKIHSKTTDLSMRLWRINPTNSVVVPQSLVLRFIVLD